jgi:hypothetical protein
MQNAEKMHLTCDTLDLSRFVFLFCSLWYQAMRRTKEPLRASAGGKEALGILSRCLAISLFSIDEFDQEQAEQRRGGGGGRQAAGTD